jgi:hypothetical protein
MTSEMGHYRKRQFIAQSPLTGLNRTRQVGCYSPRRSRSEPAIVGSDFTVHITKPDEHFGGDDERNIVNRLTAGGANGVQIEQKSWPREKWRRIADAVANVYDPKL